MKTWPIIKSMPSMDGLYCTMLNADMLSCNGNHYTFGASADSTYEYMLKQWVLTNGTDEVRADGGRVGPARPGGGASLEAAAL